MATQILVPLDGSELAEQALPCATMLAHGMRAELVLFRAVSLPPDLRAILDEADLEVSTPLAPIATEAREYLTQVAHELQSTGLSVSSIVGCGPPAETILDQVAQMGIQQIVMATHGYGGLRRWVHGSVAERVIQSSKVPVLLVRAQEKVPDTIREPLACRRILVPLDGSRLAEQVLPPVTAVARAVGAEIILFQVLTLITSLSLTGESYMPLEGIMEITQQEAQAYLERVAGDLHTQGISTRTSTQVGGVANTIVEHAEANRIDLIAMCTHGRTGLARWALGSVADRVLRAGRIPILLVRAR